MLMHDKEHILLGFCAELARHLRGGLAPILTGLVFLTAPVYGQDTTYIQWDPPQQISFDAYNSVAPQIVAVGDTVHLMWTTTNGPAVFYSRSSDAGASWSAPVVLVDTTYTTGGPAFAAAQSYGYVFRDRCPPPCTPPNIRGVLDLRRSTDAGLTWLPRSTIADDGNNTANTNSFSSARDTAVGFINTRSGLVSSQRFGWSWDTGLQWNFYDANTRTEDRFVILSNGIHLVRRQTGVGLPSAEVSYLYSSDFGQTWTPFVFLSSPDSILSDEPDIAGNDDGNLYAVWRDFKYGGLDAGTILVRRSTDFGVTWLNEGRLTPMASGRLPRISSAGNFVASVWSDDSARGVSIRFSDNNGQSFSAPFVLSPGSNPAIALSVLYVHVAWWQIVAGSSDQIFYCRGRIVTTDVQDKPRVPETFSLDQNYPNPFNPSTVIGYSLPVASYVVLKLHNILGQEVATLVDEVKQPGRYAVTWDARRLPSGVYVYRLQTPKFFAVRKCLLVK